MSIYLRIILVVISMLSMLNILKRVRKSKLQIEYSIFWIVFSILLILVAVFPQPMFVLAQILGIQSPANMVFLFVIFILLIKLFNMTIEVSQLQYKQQELVQKIALDENKKTEKKSKDYTIDNRRHKSQKSFDSHDQGFHVKYAIIKQHTGGNYQKSGYTPV